MDWRLGDRDAAHSVTGRATAAGACSSWAVGVRKTHAGPRFALSRDMVKWTLAGLLGLLIAACGGDGDGSAPDAARTGPLRCEEADLEASRELGRLWSDPNACTSDEECIAIERDIVCEETDAHLGFCPFVIHSASRSAFEALNAEIAEGICPRVEEGCRSSASCAEAEPRCGAFECHALTDSTCLSRCESLGCGECAERCISQPACVRTATTCEAVNACEPPPPSGRLIWARPYDAGNDCLEPAVVVGILDEPATSGTADIVCGLGPDGRSYVFASGTHLTAVGFPSCTSTGALRATECPL